MDHHEPASGKRSRPPPSASAKIIVVGPCASGKSTLVAALQALSYDAHVSAQEQTTRPTLRLFLFFLSEQLLEPQVS